MDRPRVLPFSDGSGTEAAHSGPPCGILALPALRCTQLTEHANRVAEEMTLLGGLVGSGALQLRRTVGTDYDQRHAGVAGLQHRWVKVRDRGSRGCEHRNRQTSELGQTKGKKGRGTFINTDMQAEAAKTICIVEGVRKRGRTRTRTKHGLANSLADQLVHHNRGQSGRRIHPAILSHLRIRKLPAETARI
jgi:hypothetical protein